MSFNGPILRVENLVKHFPVTAGVMSKVVDQVKAVDGVSFELQRGETLGLVGESGCGKTTLGRSILRLIAPTSGEIHFEGAELTKLPHRQMQPCRRDMQIIFQDPFSSLNPRMTVLDIVGEALRIHGVAKAKETEAIVHDLLRKVGLPGAWINRYPHEFSGGQRQRIGIARAIALNPKLIVCDEPVSALDVSVQAQVLNLLIKLREEMNLSYLFIAHNLAVVKHISNRVAVMYLGQIVETAASERLFEEAAHPYTLALLSAIPEPDPDRRVSRIRLEGDVPTPLNPPPGCRFHTRCPAVMERCRKEEPNSIQLGEGHEVKCFLAHDVAMGEGWRGQVMARMNEAIEENRANGATGQKPPASDSPAPDQPLEEPEERRFSPRGYRGRQVVAAGCRRYWSRNRVRHGPVWQPCSGNSYWRDCAFSARYARRETEGRSHACGAHSAGAVLLWTGTGGGNPKHAAGRGAVHRSERSNCAIPRNHRNLSRGTV